MQKIESKLTVFYQAPFWIGVYERIADGTLEVCKITFGAEPKDYQVYEFLLSNWLKLRFSPLVKACESHSGRINPKRMQRIVKKQLKEQGIGTKSQQALKLMTEENKRIKKEKSHRQKEEEKQNQYELKQKKRKEKHRGR